MNQHRYMPSGGAFFLTADEDGYAQALREARWGEHAIELELELLRKFKAEHAAAFTPPPPPDDEDPSLVDALERSRRRRSDRSEPQDDSDAR